MLCQFLLLNKVNHLYVYIYHHIPSSCGSLPPSLSHAARWSQSTELISLCYAADSHQLSILHLVVYICQCYSLTLSQITLLIPVSSSPFSMSASLFLSCPWLHENLFFFFLDYIYICQHTAFVFLFLPYFTLYERIQVPPPHYK